MTSQELGNLREAAGQKRVQKSDLRLGNMICFPENSPTPEPGKRRPKCVQKSDVACSESKLEKLTHNGPKPARVLATGRPRSKYGAVRSVDAVLTCELPLPPSVNGLYPTRGTRRCKSKEYTGWLERAQMAFYGTNNGVRFEGNVSVVYEFYFPRDCRRRDGENYCKALSDFLVHNRVLWDDCAIQKMTWHKHKSDCPHVGITITEVR